MNRNINYKSNNETTAMCVIINLLPNILWLKFSCQWTFTIKNRQKVIKTKTVSLYQPKNWRLFLHRITNIGIMWYCTHPLRGTLRGKEIAQCGWLGHKRTCRATRPGPKSIRSGKGQPLIAPRRQLLVPVSMPLQIVNRCCSCTFH